MGFSVVMGVSVVIIFSVVMGFSVVVGCASRVRSRRFAPRQRAFGALSRLKHHPLKYHQFPSEMNFCDNLGPDLGAKLTPS